jgi:hypothetical protein
MQHSENIETLLSALNKAQAQMTPPKKNCTNSHFKNGYADLQSVIDAIRKPLNENGLTYTQLVTSSDDGLMLGLETMLSHSSGQWMSSIIYCPSAAPDWHKVGSAMTYLRRYSLQAIAGVAADDDDDGNKAMELYPITEDQIKVIRSLLDKTDRTEKDLCLSLKIKSLKLLTQGRYDHVLSTISKAIGNPKVVEPEKEVNQNEG